MLVKSKYSFDEALTGIISLNLMIMKKPAGFLLVLILLIFLLQCCKKEKLPQITTTDPYAIDAFSAISGGIIGSDGGSAIVSKGVCWNTSQNPTLLDSYTIENTGSDMFSSTMTGLYPEKWYYARAYATNEIGTGYGNQVSFKTTGSITFNTSLNYGSVMDIDGNTYKTIQIGSQTWMAENLKTTRFNNDTEIPLVTSGTGWNVLTTPGYCWYSNDNYISRITYGALYNWFTVVAGNLCPAGWHVSTDDDWEMMVSFLGGVPEHFQRKLKETGTTHWYLNTPGQLHDATNSCGFTALPGGLRGGNGNFAQIRSEGHWWTSDEFDATNSHSRSLYFYDVGGSSEYYPKFIGFSVRCVKYN